ncbi:cytochrome c biogenesis CcdA family protein [Nocardioides sp. NPDC057767]|uniref:cytochrome c biogenesis CcdA family protein n=1 Tax=unclassified Nocardioides TaxID=2615069 RepID=UPI0036735911
MTDWFASTAGSGSLLLAVPIALLAGFLSFISPCTLPMLPGYLSYATGLSGADLASGDVRRGRMLAGSLLFMAGFSLVFVLLGLAAGGIAFKLVAFQETGTKILGALSIIMGIAFMGFIPLLQRDVKFHKVPAVGLAAAPLLGFLFGLAWTPCTGPTLGVILTLAYDQGTVARGGLLLAVYALGLGIPFVLVAVMWRRATVTLDWFRRHTRAITIIGGVVMILIGIAMLTGWWDNGMQWLQVQVVQRWEGIAL